MWPTQLIPLDCKDNGCVSVWSQDRIIMGECECCEVFHFRKDSEEGASRPERLENIVIHYSSRQRQDAIEAAKILARAAGFADTDISAIGRESPQHFEWDSKSPGENVYFSLEVHLTKRSKLWEAYMNLGTGALHE